MRDKVESVVRLPESSRARTKDNSRSCTIPCRYCRWALSGTGKAVSSSGKMRSARDKIRERAGRAPRYRDSFSILSRRKEKKKKKKEIPTASSSKGYRFRPIVSWISSGPTLRITSRRSDHSRPSSFLLGLPSRLSFSLPVLPPQSYI